MPRCRHSGARGFSVVNVLSVYSRYTVFRITRATTGGAFVMPKTRAGRARPIVRSLSDGA